MKWKDISLIWWAFKLAFGLGMGLGAASLVWCMIDRAATWLAGVMQ